MKTKLGTEIKEDIRGILYLCKFHNTDKPLEVVNEILFTKATGALHAYANIPNPESQLILGKTYEEVFLGLTMLHKNMEDVKWLNELEDCL